MGKIEGVWKCEPKILVFDLKTDKLLHKYTIPKNQYKPESLFVTPVRNISKN